MASQADLFGAKSDKPKAASFLEKNVAVQGVITEEPEVGTEYDNEKRAPKLDKYGKEKPQLVVTIRTNEGEEKRLFFNGSKLFALRGVLQEQGLSAVQVGGTIGMAWTDDWQVPNSVYKSKVYTVKYAAPTA